MYRFFVNYIPDGDFIRISGSDYNHIKNVLRLKKSEEVGISSPDGRTFYSQLDSYEEQCAVFKILRTEEGIHELPSKIRLYQGLPKADKLELIIQKAVELGVYEVIPVLMSRSIVKPDPKKEEAKKERLQNISESAAKQSKRDLIPEIRKVITFKEAVSEAFENGAVVLLPYENAEGMEYTRHVISEIKPGQDIAVFVGPEGGFSDEEVILLKQKGAKSITLGNRILRTETAGLYMLSVLGFMLEGK